MAPGPDMAAVAPGTPAVARPGNAPDLSTAALGLKIPRYRAGRNPRAFLDCHE